MPEPGLLELSGGGGCGCKASPKQLRELLAAAGAGAPADDRLLVGNGSADDCAAWDLGDGKVLVATTDFFMPVVDDPRDFGRIAATNAISDVYAMGARPVFALAVVGMPFGKLPTAAIARILAGGQEVCAAAGITVAGGHTITAAEPIYGLAVTGTCAREHLARNDTARPGDALVLGKPLGVGILSAALRKGNLDADGMGELLTTTTTLNAAGPALAEAGLASAMTDVTGFGLLGHALEMCRGAGVSACIEAAAVPTLPTALALARAGVATGASKRNWESYGHDVTGARLDDWQRDLLTDPQTSGGLLVACAPTAVDEVVATLTGHGCGQARQVGTFGDTTPGKVSLA